MKSQEGVLQSLLVDWWLGYHGGVFSPFKTRRALGGRGRARESGKEATHSIWTETREIEARYGARDVLDAFEEAWKGCHWRATRSGKKDGLERRVECAQTEHPGGDVIGNASVS